MTPSIRALGPPDFVLWAELAHELWPEESPARHRAEIEAMAGTGIGGRRGFVAEAEGSVVGFAEISLRPYANGCEEQPVAFLEAIWVAPEARRRGVGRALVAHLAELVRAEGRSELCSDALIDNLVSHSAHRAWGFEETERVVNFRLALG